MSIATELVDMETFINDAYNAAEENGATMPTQKNLQNLKPTIESIEGGGSGVIVYTVTFDSNGGTEVAEQIIVSGQTAKEPITTKENYKVSYWTLNGIEYDFDTPITENITLVAVWQRDFTELEYIENTGTQRLDFDYYPNSKTKVILKYNLNLDTLDMTYGLLSSGGSADKGSFMLVAYDNSNSVKTGRMTFGANWSYRVQFDDLVNSDIHVLEVDCVESKVIVDEVNEYEVTKSTFSCDTSLQTYASTPICIRYLQIFENNILISDYIPVLDENNVACLYDKVSDSYNYNQGTGSFNAGPIVA